MSSPRVTTLSEEEQLYAGFSWPGKSLDETFFAGVVEQYASSVIEVFLSRFSDSLPDASAGVVSLLETAARHSTFEQVWSPALGRALRMTKLGDELRARRVATELLLQAFAAGMCGQWEINLARSGRLLFGHHLLPNCNAMKVESDGHNCHVETKSDLGLKEISFSRPSGARLWTADSADLLFLHAIKQDRASIVLLSEDAINPEVYGGLGFPAVSQITTPKVDALVHAFDLLKNSLPEFFLWVSRILRWLILVESGEQKYLRSGNTEGNCGLVYISDATEELSIGEMLVHEASHQYFFVLTRIGLPTDPTHEELYFSPFVNTMRRLDRILLAYHAFANVYLFYRGYEQCASTQEAAEVRRRMQTVREDLKRVEEFISRPDHLTAIGSALAEPLIRELSQ